MDKKEYHAKYQQEHKEQIKERKAKYYQDHKEDIKERNKSKSKKPEGYTLPNPQIEELMRQNAQMVQQYHQQALKIGTAFDFNSL
jgi:hypothetical protein